MAALAVMGALAAVLGLTFWVVRTPPVASCGDGPSEAAMDAYQAGAIPLHLFALLVLGAIVWHMSDSRATRVALGVAAALAVTCLVFPAVFVFVAIPGLLGLAVGGPLIVLAVLVLAALSFARRRVRLRPRPGGVAIVAWLGIVLVVPGHLALVLLQGVSLFCF